MKKFSTAVNNFLNKNGTTILTTIGVVSEAIAIHEMYKAADEIKQAIADVDEMEITSKPEELWLKTKAIAKPAAPTVLWFTFGAGCIAASHKADSKKIAALTSAYEFSESYRREYVNKVKEKLGEKKAKEIDDEFYEEQAKKNMPSGPHDSAICLTGKGDQLYYDEQSGRFIRTCPQHLEKCKIDISHQVYVNNYASVNDWYCLLNIPTCGFGDKAGWNSEHDLDCDMLIDMRWDLRAGISDWGEAYSFISYEPKTRYRY